LGTAPCFNANTLFYGDNLEVLRKHFPNECIDLEYLDPPFNSKADYNILFKETSGEQSSAQIQAFSDFWHWDIEAMHAYDRLAMQSPKRVSDIIIALHDFLGKNDMFAYLVMMSERLLELHRVLKPTGSIYLHCDTTASHYLKLLLDAVFGPENFRNEIIWKRVTAHSDAKRFGRVADRLLFYSKTDDYLFNKQHWERKEEYIKSKFSHVDKDGRQFRLDNLNPPGGRGPMYEFHGLTRPWRFTEEKMHALERQGRIYTKSRVPQIIRYLDELEAKGGASVHEIWDDIAPVNSMAKERVGFQTQKPIQLLERIINASSPKDGWILDSFCGCGTAIIAAEKLHRHWLGIDITYLAVNLVKGRLRDTFPTAIFQVEGEPRDLGAARALAQDSNNNANRRYQFQWWALSLIDAKPVGATTIRPREGKKGADAGVDGWLRFMDTSEGHYEKIVVQVKSGHVGVKDVRELRDVVTMQNAALGIFLTLEEPTSEMLKEVKATDPFVSPLWKHEYPKIQILTIERLLKGERPKTPPTISQFQESPRLERSLTSIQKKLGRSTTN
jgi:site-specific DNA-methyltransferase (adenine-specific)